MLGKEILKFFPPPRYMSMPHAGLDITDDVVRMIKLKRTKYGFSVEDFGVEKIPLGFIEAGYIKDEPGLIKLLSNFAKKHKLSFVKASLPEEKMYLFKTDVNEVQKESDIRQYLEFKLEENIPLSPSEAVFYYDVVPGTSTASVSVSPRKVVDTYLNVLKSAGLSVLSFEVQAKSLARSLIDKNSKETVLLAHIMERKTGLYVVCQGVVNFTSTIPWGGQNISDQIAVDLNINLEEATKLKKMAGYHDHKDSKKVLDSALKSVDFLQREISRVYAYWKEHGEGCKDIDRLIVCGGDSLLVGLSSKVAPAHNIIVEISSVWKNVFSIDKYIPPINHDDSLDYAVAIGLAL